MSYDRHHQYGWASASMSRTEDPPSEPYMSQLEQGPLGFVTHCFIGCITVMRSYESSSGMSCSVPAPLDRVFGESSGFVSPSVRTAMTPE